MTHAATIIIALFGALLVLIEIGRRAGGERRIAGMAPVEGAIFGLMGLLIAFTFGSAAVRFENRRNYLIEEANCIMTAYLRVDLLPVASQPAIRDAFRSYVDTRLAIYRTLPDFEAAKAHYERLEKLKLEIWKGSVLGCDQTSTRTAAALLLPALNAMFDIAAKRTIAIQTHQPTVVFVMLAVVMCVCSLLAGFSMSGTGRNWLHVLAFTLALTMAFYVIIDLEYPRIGLIRIDWMDRLLVDVRNRMGSEGF